MVHSYLFCFTDQRNWWQRREESGGGGGTASASSARGSEGRVARKPSRHRVANRPPDVFHREPTESGSKHLAALLLLRERGRPERRLHRLRDPQVRPGDPRSGGDHGGAATLSRHYVPWLKPICKCKQVLKLCMVS